MSGKTSALSLFWFPKCELYMSYIWGKKFEWDIIKYQISNNGLPLCAPEFNTFPLKPRSVVIGCRLFFFFCFFNFDIFWKYVNEMLLRTFNEYYFAGQQLSSALSCHLGHRARWGKLLTQPYLDLVKVKPLALIFQFQSRTFLHVL